MIAMKFSWLLLEGILVLLFLHSGNSMALVMGVVLVLIPAAGLLIHLYLRSRIEIRFEASGNIRKGEQGHITVVLRNPTIFPVLRTVVRLQTENQLNRQVQEQEVSVWLPPRSISSTELEITSSYCGRIRICASRVSLYDCFGLIGVRCRCEAVAHMTVQPDTFEMEVSILPVPNQNEDSEVYSTEKPGADLTETFQIREYVPGDSPRQVHWKLTSKFDRLIVRDPGLPITRNVLVFWERTGESGDPDRVDAQAETVVSLCRALLDQSVQFTVGWNDTDRNQCILHEIRDLDELIAVIPRLMRATGIKEGVSGAGLLLNTRLDALCAHMVYIAENAQDEILALAEFSRVCHVICGASGVENAQIFDALHYQEQLRQIAL